MELEGEATGGYRSGVAARLSGVPVDTLRIWERRYSVIGPQFSAGRQRLYSMADIRRLALIKQLVDMGHSIGTIASLGNEESATGRPRPDRCRARPLVSQAPAKTAKSRWRSSAPCSPASTLRRRFRLAR